MTAATVGADRPVSDADGSPRAWPQRLTGVRPAMWDRIALAALVLAAGGELYYLTRGTTFWFDEWNWILFRRGSGLSPFLSPYNGHFSLVPVAIYRFLFATVGLGDYRPYRLLVIAAHLLCAVLVFVYARRRVDGFLALCATALVLFLGAAWQDILWPFQIAWLLSLAAGVGALLMLDRRDRVGDVGACVLLVVSLASSGVGAAVAAGVVVEVLWGRRNWRAAWIVAVPLALYGAWWLGYQTPQTLGQISLMPHFIANLAAATVAGLAGRGGNTFYGGAGSLLSWGRPLALVALGLFVWRVVRLRRISPRALALVATILAFWLLTAVTRTTPLFGLTQSYASRYLYVGCLFIVLLAVELVRGASIPVPVRLLVGIGVTVAVVSGLGIMRGAAADLRLDADLARADLGALEIGRPFVGPNYVAAYFPGFPLIVLRAREYFAAAKALGTPAATPAQILTLPESARSTADLELVRIHHMALAPDHNVVPSGSPPRVERVAGGTVAVRGACVTFGSGGGPAPSRTRELEVVPSSGSLLLSTRGGPTDVYVRRFAAGFASLGAVSDSRRAVVRIAPDLAAQPWHFLVVPTARATVCGAR